MRRIRLLPVLLTITCSLILNNLIAQNVSVNNNGAAADASAMLDVSGAGKGVLIPRMTRAQRPATPAEGLMIYQTDDSPGFYFYKSPSWTRVMDSTNTSGGTIIPFSPGAQLQFNVIPGPPAETYLVGFNGITAVTPGSNITDTRAVSFVAPRAGVINSLSAQFTLTNNLANIGNTRLNVTIYSAATGSNVFSPTAAAFNFPFTPGLINEGTSLSWTSQNFSFPVTAGARYMLIVTANVQNGFALVGGYFSAAINVY